MGCEDYETFEVHSHLCGEEFTANMKLFKIIRFQGNMQPTSRYVRRAAVEVIRHHLSFPPGTWL